MRTLVEIKVAYAKDIPSDTFHLASQYVRRMTDDSKSMSAGLIAVTLNIAHKFLHDDVLELSFLHEQDHMTLKFAEAMVLCKLDWKLNDQTRYDKLNALLTLKRPDAMQTDAYKKALLFLQDTEIYEESNDDAVKMTFRKFFWKKHIVMSSSPCMTRAGSKRRKSLVQ